MDIVKSLNQMEHTDGTWSAHWDDFSEKWSVISDANPFGNGHIFIAQEIEQGHDNGEADAKLIAAAPDLLDALRILLFDFASCVQDGASQPSYIIGVEAIDKAIGVVRQPERAPVDDEQPEQFGGGGGLENAYDN